MVARVKPNVNDPGLVSPGALRKDAGPLSNARHTVVIFGVPRGGTTMVAGVAQRCGLFIGDDLPANNEDPLFNSDAIRSAGQELVPALRAAVQRRNAARDRWGWKFPRAGAYLDSLRDVLVNPRLIVVSRDPVATATRHVRRGSTVVDAVGMVQSLQRRNLALVTEWQCPTFLVSYERAMANKAGFVDKLCDFLDLRPPVEPDAIYSYMRSGGYNDRQPEIADWRRCS